MAIDKKPIQDLPVKHFGDKHFSSEFNTVRNSLLDIIDGINAVPSMIESDFKGIISPSDPAPTEDGTYKPSVSSADPGTNYPNAGNLKSRDGYSTFFYKKGSVWTKSESVLQGVTAKVVYDPADNINPATMKAAADRWDKTLVTLKSFVEPTGLTDWADASWPSGETANHVLDSTMNAISNPYGSYGTVKNVDLTGVGKMRIVSDGLDVFGSGVAWWTGVRADGTFQVLRKGVITTGTAEITVDEQFVSYRYSRPTGGSLLQKQMKEPLPVETDSVMKAIKEMGSGYSGELDLATVGLKESNSAEVNTTIINQAIEDNPSKIIRIPPGSYKVNEVTLRAGTEIKGAGVLRTRLYTDVGSTARFLLGVTNGGNSRGSISHIHIDARDTTEGGIYVNNTFDHQIDNCVVYSSAQYGIKHVGGLYHRISNVYFDGSDIPLVTKHLTAMATNLIQYDRLYIVKGRKKCVELDEGSNYVFNSCNFEDSGLAGDETTGGVHVKGLSPNGEGVDVVFNNCWSEGIRGGYIFKFENCYGSSVIRDCMLYNGGNGAGSITNAVVNLNSRLLISGATRFSESSPTSMPFPTNIRALNGFTYIDNPNINVGTNNVGTILKAQYA